MGLAGVRLIAFATKEELQRICFREVGHEDGGWRTATISHSHWAGDGRRGITISVAAVANDKGAMGSRAKCKALSQGPYEVW
jgi:hypothetical protein